MPGADCSSSPTAWAATPEVTSPARSPPAASPKPTSTTTAPIDAGAALEAALIAANRRIAETVADHAELTGMGTTVSAMLHLGDRVVISHIGDSRIYLLRSGELSQISTDHTFVQRLVDAGRITAEEAMVHPRRSVLMRVLGDVEASPEIDQMVLDTRDGDRWMLCSDGLSGVASFDEILEIMSTDAGQSRSPTGSSRRRSTAARPTTSPSSSSTSASRPRRRLRRSSSDRPLPRSRSTPLPNRPGPAASVSRRSGRTRCKRRTSNPTRADFFDEIIEEDARRRRRRRWVWGFWIVLLIAAIVAAFVLGYQWTQTRYYVGESNGRVAVFQGIQQNLGPLSLHELHRETPSTSQSCARTISSGSSRPSAPARSPRRC